MIEHNPEDLQNESVLTENIENEPPITQQRPCTRMNTFATNQDNVRLNNYIHGDMGELPETARNVLIEIEGAEI